MLKRVAAEMTLKTNYVPMREHSRSLRHIFFLLPTSIQCKFKLSLSLCVSLYGFEIITNLSRSFSKGTCRINHFMSLMLVLLWS